MTKKLSLDINSFAEDEISVIYYDQLSSFYIANGYADRLASIEEISYPQSIEFEFGDSLIIATHEIKSPDPLVFRYIYKGEFAYDDLGVLSNASFNEVSVAYYNPEDGSEYGGTHSPIKSEGRPIIMSDTSSFIDWDNTMTKIFESARVDEYEKLNDVVVEDGVVTGENSQYFPVQWYSNPFLNNFVNEAEQTVEVIGELGDDSLQGSPHIDRAFLNGGNDIFYGLGGNDLIYGNEGNDTLYGNTGNDLVYSGKGADTIFGGKGDDYIYGNLGGDKIFGNLGDDIIFAGQGNDIVYAGQGDDVIFGNKGNDVIWGNKGADIFWVTQGYDVVKDFWAQDGDKVSVSGNVSYSISDLNGSTLISSGNSQVLLDGFARVFFDDQKHLIVQ